MDAIPLPSVTSQKLKLWAVGYPSNTKGRERFGTRDSAGDKLYASGGIRLPCEQIVQHIVPDLKQELSGYIAKIYEESAVCMSADMTVGLSGAPVVTSDGKVLGIATEGYSIEPSKRKSLVEEPAYLSSFSKLVVLP